MCLLGVSFGSEVLEMVWLIVPKWGSFYNDSCKSFLSGDGFRFDVLL